MKRIFLFLGLCATPAYAQDTAFDWKLHPEVGSKWQIRSYLRFKLVTITPNSWDTDGSGRVKAERTILSKGTEEWEVLSKDKAGAFTVRITFGPQEHSITSTWWGRQIIRVEQPSGSPEWLFGRVTLGRQLIMKVAPNGRVYNVIGLDPIRRAWFRAATKPGSEVSPQEANALAKRLTKEDLEMQTGYGSLPTTRLQVGEGYSYVSKPSSSGSMNNTFVSTNTYLAREGNLAKFRRESVIMDAPVASQPATTFNTDKFVHGRATGFTHVDTSSGFKVRSGESIRGKMLYRRLHPTTKQPGDFQVWALMESHTVTEPMGIMVPPLGLKP